MTNLEQRVMASVRIIYTVRSLTSATALKLYVLALSFAGIVMLVSVSDVAVNFAHVSQGGVGNIAGYAIAAVLGTKFVVQLALIVGLASFVSLVAPALRSLSSNKTVTA